MHAHLHAHPPQTKQFAAPEKRFLPIAQIVACDNYRSAVQLAWKNRTRQHMTQTTLGEECGLYAPHVSSYLNPKSTDKHGNRRLDLPADKIAAFEASVGNHGVSQYLTRLCALTLMEEVIAQRSL